MALPTNIGSGFNIDTNRQFSSGDQIQSTQELQSSASFNASSRQSLSELVSESNVLIDKSEIKAKSFITGEKTENKKVDINLVFSLENNKNSELNDEIINDIKNYKNQKINNLYEGVENKASMLLALHDNDQKYFDHFFEKISDFNNVKIKINDAITEKTENVLNNNFESKLKSYISNPSSSTLFNLVTNYFIENANQENNQKNLSSFNRVKLYEGYQSSISNQIDVPSIFKNQCLLETSINTDSSSKVIRSIINDLNIQNIVTMIRNLYFMSPNTFVDNYSEVSKINFINIERDSMLAYTSERDNIDIFKFINGNDVDIENFISINDLNELPDNELAYSNQVEIFDSIDELQGKQYFSQSLKSYIDEVMIRNFKEVNHIKDNLLFRLGFSQSMPDSILAAREYNKFFTGNFFDIDLNQTGVERELGTTELLFYIEFDTNINNSDNYVNRLFKDNYLNRSNEIIYKFKSPITSYVNRSNIRDNKGVIRASDRLSLDDSSVVYLKDLLTKNKVDRLVKKQKINFLINNGISLDFADEIIKNINKTTLNKKLVAYCNEDKDNFAIVNSKNQIFNLLFTADEEDEKTFYSHVDIVSDHMVNDTNFKGLDTMKALEIFNNEEYIKISDNIKNLISMYYQKNNFFSSSYFYKNILKSILKELEIIEAKNFEENNLTQCIYFNFFKKGFSDNIEAKKLAAQRFLKRAIQLDSVSSSSFRNSKHLSSFRYKNEEVLESDFDNSSKESMKSYIDNVLSTSENLKKIKSSIFSLKNVKNLNMLSDYKRISNMQLVSDVYSGEFETSHYSITAIINANILPNYCMLYNFKSKGNFKEDGSITIDLKTKNNISEKITFGDINPENGKREVEKIDYFVNRQNKEFDVTNSKDILINITPRLCLSDEKRVNHSFPSITIKDTFDQIFRDENSSSYTFSKIIDIIQDMLRMSVKDYLKLKINNESDIDKLISNNPSIVEDIISLLEIYSDYYLLFVSRLQRMQALKIFKWQKKEIQNSVFANGTNNSFPLNGIVSKHSSVFSKFKNAMNLQSSDNISILSSNESEDYFRDIKSIVTQYESSPNLFLVKPSSEYDSLNYKTHNTCIINNIIHSLYLSDFSQSFNFDIINGFLNHQNKILELPREEVSSSKIFEEITEISSDLLDNIEENFYDIFYLNKLSKIINYLSIKNNSNYKYIKDKYQNIGYSLHKNCNIFEKLKKQKIEDVNLLGNKIQNKYNLQNYTFLDNNNQYLNSSFKSFSLSNKNLKNKNSKSILKIKVSIIDKLNLDRIYLPKVYLFSPMIDNVDIFSKDILSDSLITSNDSNKIGIFDIRNDLLTRLSLQSTESSLDDDFIGIKQILQSKFNKLNSEEINILYRYLISCHVSSYEIENILKYCYNLNISKGYYKNSISINIFNLANNISDVEFFDVFNTSKQKTLDKMIFDENTNRYFIPNRSDVINSNNLVYDTLTKLENLYSFEELENIKDDDYYNIYNISINPESFYYLNSSESVRDDIEAVLDRDEVKNIEKVFEKINDLQQLSNQDVLFKKSKMSIDSFDIIFETEVL